jgi:hypothetical protein
LVVSMSLISASKECGVDDIFVIEWRRSKAS